MKESYIQKKVNEYAKSKKMLIDRFVNRSAPDRMYTPPGGNIFCIEFKATGEKASDAQETDHLARRCYYIDTYVIDDIERGIQVIDFQHDLSVLLLRELTAPAQPPPPIETKEEDPIILTPSQWALQNLS